MKTGRLIGLAALVVFVSSLATTFRSEASHRLTCAPSMSLMGTEWSPTNDTDTICDIRSVRRVKVSLLWLTRFSVNVRVDYKAASAQTLFARISAGETAFPAHLLSKCESFFTDQVASYPAEMGASAKDNPETTFYVWCDPNAL